MGLFDLIDHLLNFVAPAIFVAGVLALLGRFYMKKVPSALVFKAQFAINMGAGVLALVAGLWFFGRDGKMASYIAMVVAIALAQWLGARQWR
jgi:hypothetical protein